MDLSNVISELLSNKGALKLGIAAIIIGVILNLFSLILTSIMGWGFIIIGGVLLVTEAVRWFCDKYINK